MGAAAGIALLGLALIVTGGLFGAEPLYVPGGGFVALGVLVPAWLRVAARGAQVTREITTRRVVEEDPLEVLLTVKAGLLPPLGGRIADPLLPEGAPAPLVAPGGTPGHVRVTVRFARRGRRRLGPPALVLSDPLGLARATVPGRGEDDILVLPRTGPVQFATEGGAARAGRAPALVASAAMEVDGLRPYREGAAASRIHWPAVARGAGLMERRLRGESDSRPLIVLDARAPERPEDLDAAVRAAASLCHELARAGGCSLLLPGDRRGTVIDADLGGWPALHARLALVDSGPGTPPPATAAGEGRRGPVVYVSA
ncbi:MAG: hypothetical protein JWN32_1658, partial [Solirubrobacterales bacterium]|nr:hypothetical protein [Solirubrobacterales bacterium]